MTLRHSRHGYEEAAWDQKLETFLRLHERAFRDLGGVPAVVRLDYVARHTIALMCLRPICGRSLRSSAMCDGGVELRPHNGSEGGEPVKKRLVVSPDGRSAGCFCARPRGLAELQRQSPNPAMSATAEHRGEDHMLIRVQ
jgi:hypothetical protein